MEEEKPEQMESIQEEIVHKNITENADSIEISTPSKGGAIKCYLDFNKTEECKAKIKNAIEIRQYANNLLNE